MNLSSFQGKRSTSMICSPAAKAWQVSRHTPTLVWSLTLSMMLFSSEKVPPTVEPWPHMFSSTDHVWRGNREEAAVTFRTRSLNPAATTPDAHAELTLPLHLFIPWSTVCSSFFFSSLHRLCVFSGIRACRVFLSYKWHLRYASQTDCSGAQ